MIGRDKAAMFSHRTNWSFVSNPLTLRLHELKEKHVKIFDLTESNPTHAGFHYPQKEILKSLSKPSSIFYQPAPFGDIKAREAICKMYQRQGLHCEPFQVILTASSSEAYSFLFRLLLNPQDAVLFPRPSYPLFDFLAQLNDVEIQQYPLAYQEGWGIDEKRFKQVITKKTKALVLVNPNNPTGSFVKDKELDFIHQICQEHQLAIICDEVFFDYSFSEKKFSKRSLVDQKKVLTFTLGGLSKSLGLPQMKLSWIVVNGPQEKVEKALERLEMIADTYLSVNTPSQHALSDWLLHKEEIQKQIKLRVEKNRKALVDALSKTSLKLLHAEGGWYAVVCLGDESSEENWVLALLEQKHVFVHPGYFFDFDAGAQIIVSLLTPEDIFKEGMRRIVDCSVSSPLI